MWNCKTRRLSRTWMSFATAGLNRALDYTFDNVADRDGWIDLRFISEVEYPCIAGIEVEGAGYSRKINCGGPAWEGHEADLVQHEPKQLQENRYLETDDFYRDYAATEFGEEAAKEIEAIFAKVDCHHPTPFSWVTGPGNIAPDPRPAEEMQKEYAFVAELEQLRGKIKSAEGLERYDYWLNQFRHMRSTAKLRLAWQQYNVALASMKAEKDPAAKKDRARKNLLPLRIEMVRLTQEAYEYLLATVSTPGEMGNISNWEQHNIPTLLERPGQELARILGETLAGKCDALERIYRKAPSHRADRALQCWAGRSPGVEGNSAG